MQETRIYRFCPSSPPMSNFDRIGSSYSCNVATPYGADDMEMWLATLTLRTKRSWLTDH